MPTLITTNRLYLRPYQKGDRDVLFDAGLRNKEHLSRFEADNFLCGLKDDDQAEVELHEIEKGWSERRYFFYGIYEKETSNWVGQVYIGPINWELPTFSIGYIADVAHQRKGYITEAVKAVTYMLINDLGAHRIQADCNDANIRSWKLLERCGFKREGHLRENKIGPDGNYNGDYIYGILKSEYPQS